MTIHFALLRSLSLPQAKAKEKSKRLELGCSRAQPAKNPFGQRPDQVTSYPSSSFFSGINDYERLKLWVLDSLRLPSVH